MIKGKKGFTLIELMLVVTIIVILVALVVVSLISARQKTKISAFKAQAHSVQVAAILRCNNANITVGIPGVPASGYMAAYTITNQNCGVTGRGVFTLRDVSTGLATACTATIRDTGVTYSPC